MGAAHYAVGVGMSLTRYDLRRYRSAVESVEFWRHLEASDYSYEIQRAADRLAEIERELLTADGWVCEACGVRVEKYAEQRVTPDGRCVCSACHTKEGFSDDDPDAYE